MTDLIPASKNQPTMSSKEIADLVEARHNDVVATIERLFEKGLLRSDRKTSRVTTGGRPLDVYRLTERDTHLVVAGYSDEHRAKVIDRWQELEQREAVPAWAKNISQAAQIALEDLSAQVDHYRSETERLNAVCNDLAANLREGLTPPAFCRMLNGVNTNRVQPLLVERKRLLKTPHGYRVAAAYRDKLFTERRHFNEEGRLCEKVVLTLKGAKWLYAEYEKGNLAMKQDWDGNFSHLVLDQREIAA